MARIAGVDLPREKRIEICLLYTSRKPEPYHGKGIRYENETIRRKEGKAGKK